VHINLYSLALVTATDIAQVEFDGTTVVFSCPGASFNGTDSGAVFTFVKQGKVWIPHQV
jgi:hypothetical protein